MLNFDLEERIKPNEEILKCLSKTDYKVVNGVIRTLKGTNLKFTKPTEYIIRKPIKIKILEYKINEINDKPFLIEAYHKKYSQKEIKNLLNQLTK